MVTSGVSRNSLQEQLAQAMEAAKKGTEVVALIQKQLKEMDQVNSEHKACGKTGGKASAKARRPMARVRVQWPVGRPVVVPRKVSVVRHGTL